MSTERSIRATAEAAIERAADWAIDSGWIRNDINDLADIIYLLLPIVEAAKGMLRTERDALPGLGTRLRKALDALEAG